MSAFGTKRRSEGHRSEFRNLRSIALTFPRLKIVRAARVKLSEGDVIWRRQVCNLGPTVVL